MTKNPTVPADTTPVASRIADEIVWWEESRTGFHRPPAPWLIEALTQTVTAKGLDTDEHALCVELAHTLTAAGIQGPVDMLANRIVAGLPKHR